jgi:hypothetical protein
MAQKVVTEEVEKEEEEEEVAIQRPTGRSASGTAKLATAFVEIRGLRPLLMSSPREVFEAASAKTKTRKSSHEYDDAEEAEKRAYRDAQGDLCVPARCLMANLVKASKLYKTKTKSISLKDMLTGSVFIDSGNPKDPDNVKLIGPSGKPLKKYEISRELVVVQRARIVRARPLIKEWGLQFMIKWNPQLYGLSAEQIEQVLNDGGYIGILDWRPRYGIFKVESFKVQKGK